MLEPQDPGWWKWISNKGPKFKKRSFGRLWSVIGSVRRAWWWLGIDPRDVTPRQQRILPSHFGVSNASTTNQPSIHTSLKKYTGISGKYGGLCTELYLWESPAYSSVGQKFWDDHASVRWARWISFLQQSTYYTIGKIESKSAGRLTESWQSEHHKWFLAGMVSRIKTRL